MAKTVSRSDIANMLKLSAQRISQLEANGVIPAPKGGRYDALAAALGYLEHVRKDEDGKASRSALRQMAAARIEKRLRAELKQLVTPDEIDEVLDDAWVLAREMHVRWLSEVFYFVRDRAGISEMETRRIVGTLEAGAIAYQQAYRRALAGLKDNLKLGVCTDSQRISELLASLMVDAPADVADVGARLVADDPEAAAIISGHLADMVAETDRYRARLAAERAAAEHPPEAETKAPSRHREKAKR